MPGLVLIGVFAAGCLALGYGTGSWRAIGVPAGVAGALSTVLVVGGLRCSGFSCEFFWLYLVFVMLGGGFLTGRVSIAVLIRRLED